MRNGLLRPYRERVIGAAEGTVLEIGAGSGLNLTLYPPRVKEVIGLELDPTLIRMSRKRAPTAACPITFLEASAEAIPMEATSVDSVITTWTLCSIEHVSRALREIRRVLKPGGRLLFVEHGLAPDLRVRKWQHRLTPAWSAFSGGCHLDRPIERLVADAGFKIDRMQSGYMPGPRIMTFMYEGCARPA